MFIHMSEMEYKESNNVFNNENSFIVCKHVHACVLRDCVAKAIFIL